MLNLLYDFNSIKVRLELDRSSCGIFQHIDFNSIKVRLEHCNMMIQFMICMLFQFHKGTIRTEILAVSSPLNVNFNSIKVRLELSQMSDNYTNISKFQFHKGTIRTEAPNRLLSLVAIFQFHKGTIRTFHIPLYVHPYSYFNSIKVRLELPKTSILPFFKEFQFHKGTIRTL